MYDVVPDQGEESKKDALTVSQALHAAKTSLESFVVTVEGEVSEFNNKAGYKAVYFTVKKEHPNARICFIGPCAAKKLEANRRSVRSDVDFVLTFEELQGMFDAKEVDFSKIEENPEDDFTRRCCAGAMRWRWCRAFPPSARLPRG